MRVAARKNWNEKTHSKIKWKNLISEIIIYISMFVFDKKKKLFEKNPYENTVEERTIEVY